MRWGLRTASAVRTGLDLFRTAWLLETMLTCLTFLHNHLLSYMVHCCRLDKEISLESLPELTHPSSVTALTSPDSWHPAHGP